MLPSTILLVDHHAPLVHAWQRAFEDVDGVHVAAGDFFAHDADAMVSPANSFGVMDGGIDRAIRDRLGFHVERALQARIVERHHGELHVGSAEIVETGHDRWPWLVAAPTMRVPESVAQTVNAYVAFRAILLAVRAHNEASPARPIRTLLCPGLGTGIGAMDPERCAVQMRMAHRQVLEPARIPSFDRIHAIHRALRTS
ncbi:macro domain-containing protein [Sandaracinus amylolyticus]|uniref:macro domain-containing protein n=1 Tax=Sandaracinus amylolyticus TaxID=927083 RepID=UPI001F1CF7E0|nr:macro domain-containing protein [Sandaracinus amylolyticus]UJR85807.1 Hypothetical protein I5071_78870 [Sandaracinus amylolyticus]